MGSKRILAGLTLALCLWAQNMGLAQFSAREIVFQVLASAGTGSQLRLSSNVVAANGEWDWEPPRLMVSRQKPVHGLYTVDTTFYFLGASSNPSMSFLFNAAGVQSSSPVDNLAVTRFQGVHEVLGCSFDYDRQKLDIMSFDQTTLAVVDTVLRQQNWYEDTFVALSSSDSLLSLFTGKEELFVAEHRGHEWTVTQVTGDPTSAFRNVNPCEAYATAYGDVRLVGYGAGLANMAISFHAGRWFTQVTKSPIPYINGGVSGWIGQRVIALNDGSELSLVYRNGEKGNELVVLYTPAVLFLADGWISWPFERYEFPAEIRGVAHNNRIVGVAAGNKVYVFPVYRFRKHIGVAFTGGSTNADTLEIPRNFGHHDVSGLAIDEANGVWVSAGKSGTWGFGEIWHFRNRGIATSVPGSESSLPTGFSLAQNYPNPFNMETIINYQIPQAGWVSLKVFNLLGRKIRTLVDREMEAGIHKVHWDGRDNAGIALSGIYFCQLETSGFKSVMKMTLMK